MTKFTDTFNRVVNIQTYHEELEGNTGQYRLFNSYGQLNEESMTLDSLFICDGKEQHIMYLSSVEKLTEYLMAYGLMNQFKAQRGFITYDFETLSDQVMKNITDQTTLLSQLSKLSIASTEVYPNRDKSYELTKRSYTLFDELANDYQEQLEKYELPFNSSFVHLWLAQTFESAEQIFQYCELWIMGVPIGDLKNTKSITVTHKRSRMKLQFIDAENLFGPMTLKTFVKDYGDKTEHKDVFPYEIINSKNRKQILVKTEAFEYEDFKSQLKGGYSITKDEFDQYLIDFKRFTNRLEYLKYCNINDIEIMVKPLINLIDTFEQFNIDVLHYISIASCAYATKHYSTYFPSQFNLESDTNSVGGINADYSNPNSQAKPFINIEIENKEEVIGEYMYSQAQKHSLPMTKKDRRLTTLVDTNGQCMVFNNYYLWLLIDLDFIITDYKAIAVFEKNSADEPFA
ncbi:MAG: hypothetical protein EZS28_018300 [Streblomastix strix]|uniref:Uncharacterized protein n=1 Tax=Streblomastix strix TaxID=222440 RepID=A0A5J4VU18_9EUKA|nr:MAG: hypothetical protein EZS28_018300 [Streblomastix strix]